MKIIKLYFILFISLFVELSIAYGQYVTLHGKQFIDTNGSLFYPLVCNYWLTYTHQGSNYYFSPYFDYGATNVIECTNTRPAYKGLKMIFIRLN